MKTIIIFVGVCVLSSICLIVFLFVSKVSYENKILYEENQSLEEQIHIATDALRVIGSSNTKASLKARKTLEEIEKVSDR